MPQRKNIKGDLGTTKVASDSYDIDNIYLSDEGWVYRHYKKADKSVWWDEIIVAGEVPASDSPEATNPPKLGTEESPTFETGGDDIKDFEHSPLYGNDIVGGGVPNLYSVEGDDGTTPPSPPAPPETSIGGVNIDIAPAAMTVGNNATFAASIGGDATVTWEWTMASGPGNATFTYPNAATTQIQVDTAGDYVFTAEASSTDANLTGGSPNSLNTGTITATA